MARLQLSSGVRQLRASVQGKLTYCRQYDAKQPSEFGPMEWFSRNSAAIQALASVASLIVAGVLAYLTAKYVRLTRDIAKASADQSVFLRESAGITQRQNALALKALVRRIRLPLGELNAASPTHQQMMWYAHLEDRDISDLEALAKGVSQEAVTLAGKAAVSLRTIHGMLLEAKKVNLSTGWYANPEQTKRWQTAVEAGGNMLQALEQACDRVAAS